jgi:predicted permease
VRREGELAIRAALGAGTWALRRALLVESLLLCGAGALLGVFSARPMVAVLSRYAARYSVRALDLTVDSSMLWVGAGLALAAAVLLAFVPRLPSAESSQGAGMANGGVRSTVGRGTSRRLRLFAVIQVAASFLLLAGAVTLVKTLLALQSAQTGFDTRHVLALNVPPMTFGRSTDQVVASYKEAIRRIGELPGVSGVAVGTVVPWREGESSFSMQFSTEGRLRGANEDDPRARFRTISPGFFATLGVPILAGRDFNDSDSPGSERVVIISQSLAQRMFPNQDAVNRHMMWTDPVLKFIGISADPRRIVGVVADVEDEKITPGPAITVYHPLGQAFAGQRAFVHTRDNPYALVSPVTSILRSMAPDQVVEHAASLEDIRAEVLAPDRLNTIVFGGFAAVALAIAVVGVAGVLAFSVSGRTREFGIRLAIGSEPRQLLMNVLSQGLVMAASGILAGLLCGLALLRVAASYLEHVQHPGATPIAVSALLLLLAALFASVLPALRAARVDIMRALRTD